MNEVDAVWHATGVRGRPEAPADTRGRSACTPASEPSGNPSLPFANGHWHSLCFHNDGHHHQQTNSRSYSGFLDVMVQAIPARLLLSSRPPVRHRPDRDPVSILHHRAALPRRNIPASSILRANRRSLIAAKHVSRHFDNFYQLDRPSCTCRHRTPHSAKGKAWRRQASKLHSSMRW
jgi:hypothetical protein